MNSSVNYENGLIYKTQYQKNSGANKNNIKNNPIIGTWIQNVITRQSTDNQTTMSNNNPLAASRQSSFLPRNVKCVSPMKTTVMSFPSDSVAKPYSQQHVSNVVNYPRPQSLMYDSQKMAYRHHSLTADDDETKQYSSNKNEKNSESNSESIILDRHPFGINNSSTTSQINHQQILPFNYLCASAISQSPVARNSAPQPMKPTNDLLAMNCLSIKPVMKFTNSYGHSTDRRGKPIREDFPFSDPLVNGSRAFLNRLTEITILTQNTIRQERSRRLKTLSKKQTCDLTILCK